jgi:RNA polymerase primary sigma factor
MGDERPGTPEDHLLWAIFGGTKPAAMSEEDKQNLRAQAERLLQTLRPKEARILRMRFGIGDDTPQSLQSATNSFGLTRERVHEIEAKALQKLKSSKTLEDLLRKDE